MLVTDFNQHCRFLYIKGCETETSDGRFASNSRLQKVWLTASPANVYHYDESTASAINHYRIVISAYKIAWWFIVVSVVMGIAESHFQLIYISNLENQKGADARRSTRKPYYVVKLGGAFIIFRLDCWGSQKALHFCLSFSFSLRFQN